MTVTTLGICTLCRRPVNPLAHSTLHRITGWERRGIAASRRGGSDIVGREPVVGEYAHPACVERKRLGLPTNQMSLDGPSDAA